MLLENYLQEIQRGSSLRKPSPTFAYELVYGKSPAGFRRGRFPGKYESKIWNGISVDSHLKDEWLDGLNSIKEIEMRGSCEGHTKEWITFITFRITNKSKESDEKYLDKILEKFTPSKDFQLTRNNLQAVFNATKFEHNF